jgi:hypothetical protein
MQTFRNLGNSDSVFRAQRMDDDGQVSEPGERLDFLSGNLGIDADAQVDVKAYGSVTESEQDFPQDEAVLAARNSHGNPFVEAEHAVAFDRTLNLPQNILVKTRGAKCAVVARQPNYRSG